MTALIMASVFNGVPPGAAVPDGVLVFPVPPVVGWLVMLGLLAVSCALLGLVAAGRPWWGMPPLMRWGRFRPVRPQPQRS
jgi:hypothetical protein